MTIVEYLCTFSFLTNLFISTCGIAEGEKVVAQPTPPSVDQEAYGNIPTRCIEYRRQVELSLENRWNRRYTSLIMAQILQESACRANVKSPVGAAGLMQIMPTTAQDIVDRIARDIGQPDVNNPIWNIRAGISYQRNMFLSIRGAEDMCAQYSMALSGYNGGIGWVARDRRLTEVKDGNKNKWFGFNNTSHWSKRASWAFKENRGYVQRIVHELNPRFLSAGFSGIPLCQEK